MAKRKTPKMKNLRPEKITSEQLNQLQTVVKNIGRIKSEIGSVEAQKHELLHVLFQMNENVNQLQEDFKKQYGTDEINISAGSINYGEDGKVNS